MTEPTQTAPVPRPEVNFVDLLRRTVAKVIASTGLEENEASIRMVSTCLVCIAAEYTQATGDAPEHIERLFGAFLRGTPEKQQEAIRKFGEATTKPEPKLIVAGK